MSSTNLNFIVGSIQWGETALKVVHCKSFSLTIWRETTLEDFKTTFKWPEYKDGYALWFGGDGYKTLSQRFQPSVSTLRKWKCRETGLEARSGRPIAKHKGWSKTTHRPPSKTFKVILLWIGFTVLHSFNNKVHLSGGKAVRVSDAEEASSVFAVLLMGILWKLRVAWIPLNFQRVLENNDQQPVAKLKSHQAWIFPIHNPTHCQTSTQESLQRTHLSVNGNHWGDLKRAARAPQPLTVNERINGRKYLQPGFRHHWRLKESSWGCYLLLLLF